ncbi:hypothetical protein NXS19_008012 [Fusarium pseudograminearum]|nr:hypothetical protein NXS19_008012 [Fusarium pseudograminearum]
MEVRVYSKSQEQSNPMSSQPEYESQKCQGTTENAFRRTTEVLEPMEITRLRQELLRTAIRNHPHQASFLDNLECRLSDLYEQAKTAEKFDRAIEIAEIAEIAFHGHHSRRCPWLSRLGDELGNRFKRNGSLNDLDRAVELAEEAIMLTIDFTPEYPGLLHTLVSRLRNRYNYTYSIADIHRAIDKMTAAVRRTSRKNPNRDAYLISLADLLGIRFDRTKSKIDIVKAIRHARNVIKNTAPDHPDGAKRLSILGTLLLSRYEFGGSTADLDHAIKHTSSSANIATREQVEYPAILGNFAGCLFRRYIHERSLEDLNLAIEVLKTAVVNIPSTDPWYPKLLYNFGLYHVERFKNTNANEDLEDSIALYKQGLDCLDTPPSIRVRLAHAAAEAFVADNRWKEASNILDDAVRLLPSISTRLLGDLDKQMALADATGLATFAAAAALNADKCAEHALELLELGRGVIASDILDTRTSTMDLERQYPELASKFESLRDELDSQPPTRVLAVEWETQAKERRELYNQFRSTCDTIRALPGFKDFLLPPNALEMKAAASLGPVVVINTNKYRCDAFIVREDEVHVLRLHSLAYTDFQVKARVSAKLLRELWVRVTCPVLTELGLMQETGYDPAAKTPRLWWVLTGALSRFPIHAAGLPNPESTETVLDRVVSSYSPSIKALIHAREKSKKRVPESAVLISMSTTPSCPSHIPGDLAFARQEVEMLKDILPKTISRTEFDKPRKQEVMRGVRDSSIFHFAGHGISNITTPSNSCLLLEDWVRNPLTVKDLTSLRLSDCAWLAYLSACSTGENQIEQLQDESIHLVSACQLAGFRHVVGSLWRVDDRRSLDMASIVYKTIIEGGWTDEAVALGVHNATKRLRDEMRSEYWAQRDKSRGQDSDMTSWPEEQEQPNEGGIEMTETDRGIGYAWQRESYPQKWAAYIHIGP